MWFWYTTLFLQGGGIAEEYVEHKGNDMFGTYDADIYTLLGHAA